MATILDIEKGGRGREAQATPGSRYHELTLPAGSLRQHASGSFSESLPTSSAESFHGGLNLLISGDSTSLQVTSGQALRMLGTQQGQPARSLPCHVVETDWRKHLG